MILSGKQTINTTRAKVWNALSNPTILAQCIEGCDYLNQVGDKQFTGQVQAKVGPIRASFKGDVTMTDVVPGQQYRLIGEGKGGVAGFAKGSALVQLADAPEGTELTYEVDAQVGGKIAQLGARLIDATAQNYAKTFFERLKTIVEQPEMAAEAPDTASAAHPVDTDAPAESPAQTRMAEASGEEAPEVLAAFPAAEADTAGAGSDKAHPGTARWIALIIVAALAAALAVWLYQG